MAFELIRDKTFWGAYGSSNLPSMSRWFKKSVFARRKSKNPVTTNGICRKNPAQEVQK